MGQLARWSPPQTVTVTLMYGDGSTERLWTTEALFTPPGLPDDGTRWFLACGPANKLVPPIARTFVEGLPPRSYAVLWTRTNRFGQVVFAQPSHQMN